MSIKNDVFSILTKARTTRINQAIKANPQNKEKALQEAKWEGGFKKLFRSNEVQAQKEMLITSYFEQNFSNLYFFEDHTQNDEYFINEFLKYYNPGCFGGRVGRHLAKNLPFNLQVAEGFAQSQPKSATAKALMLFKENNPNYLVYAKSKDLISANDPNSLRCFSSIPDAAIANIYDFVDIKDSATGVLISKHFNKVLNYDLTQDDSYKLYPNKNKITKQSDNNYRKFLNNSYSDKKNVLYKKEFIQNPAARKGKFLFDGPGGLDYLLSFYPENVSVNYHNPESVEFIIINFIVNQLKLEEFSIENLKECNPAILNQLFSEQIDSPILTLIKSQLVPFSRIIRIYNENEFNNINFAASVQLLNIMAVQNFCKEKPKFVNELITGLSSDRIKSLELLKIPYIQKVLDKKPKLIKMIFNGLPLLYSNILKCLQLFDCSEDLSSDDFKIIDILIDNILKSLPKDFVLKSFVDSPYFYSKKNMKNHNISPPIHLMFEVSVASFNLSVY